MFEELAPRRSGALRSIFLIVFFGFIALALPGFVDAYNTPFDLPYATSVYQLFIFVVLAFFILWYIRSFAVEYKYVINGSTLTVLSKSGARESVVFRGKITSDSQIFLLSDGGELIKENQWKPRKISFGVADKKRGYLMTFPANKANSALIFQPSAKFVEILQQISLDKRSEM